MTATDISSLVKSSRPVIPQIYAYTTPEIHSHDGWTKIGYTERPVEKRIAEQTKTANVEAILQWNGNATWEDGSGTFKDTKFHDYLRKLGIEQMRDKQSGKWLEWLHIDPDKAHTDFYQFRENHGVISKSVTSVSSYQLRDEQERAVEKTLTYARSHENGQFLWNAKPRFGKTLTTYDFIKRYLADKPGPARNVLIVTNRPVIATSWYNDYSHFLGLQSGYRFVSGVSALQDKEKYPLCLSREEFMKALRTDENGPTGCIEFVSLQDLKGSVYFGGSYEKLEEVANLHWDVLVIDEAHEGVDTFKTDVAFDHINRDFTLHLSGTPFKALANEKFPEDAIFNWTYADEQQAKRDWDKNHPTLRNPYAEMPRLSLFTYQMGDIVLNKAQQGADINGEQTDYAFDLSEFFATNDNGHFIHDKDVDRFLDALTHNTKYPFSTPELRNELKHTLWMLDRVDSAKALYRKLERHPLFKDYKLILAAGDGSVDEEKEAENAYTRVTEAIKKYDKTITLSVGQLTVGVTVPQWAAVLMLSNMHSPALYMQAAFRAQNPDLETKDGKSRRKENAYVFDFDPARTLDIYEQFANDLDSDTAGGHGDTDERKQHVRKLLNFFPVIGEDEQGQMTELNAERVLSIPRKIHSREVVRRGFMSDFLFCNIGNIFHAPAEVLDTVTKLTAIKEPVIPLGISEDTVNNLDLDENGEVEIPEDKLLKQQRAVFGDKKFEDISNDIGNKLDAAVSQAKKSSADIQDDLLEQIFNNFTKPLVSTAKEHYGKDLKPAQSQHLERRIASDANIEFHKQMGNYKIQHNIIEAKKKKQLAASTSDAEDARINAEAQAEHKANQAKLIDNLKKSSSKLIEQSGKDIVREVETAKRETVKQGFESEIRDHLRGFSRTIPSFLMAYGNENTRLENFEAGIPEDVFKDVTSITIKQFRLLRDGGEARDKNGKMVHYDGHLFDPVVFNDSVKEFMALKERLADYFDESQKEDIFDYIPPQKTNQIFTPRHVVVDMVDAFERENPGCFDDPTHTFADLYMKSGLYLTEIIKRLYRSDGMKRAYPDEKERLRHILEHQIFGIAPSEIIYRIATHYILGFTDDPAFAHLDTNFAQVDSAKLAQEGKLADYVEKTFGAKM